MDIRASENGAKIGFNGFNDFSCQAPVSIPVWAAIRGLVLGGVGLVYRRDVTRCLCCFKTPGGNAGRNLPSPESWSRLRGGIPVFDAPPTFRPLVGGSADSSAGPAAAAWTRSAALASQLPTGLIWAASYGLVGWGGGRGGLGF